MCFGALLLGSHINVLWIVPFITIKCSLSSTTIFVLKSILSDINIAAYFFFFNMSLLEIFSCRYVLGMSFTKSLLLEFVFIKPVSVF